MRILEIEACVNNKNALESIQAAPRTTPVK